MVQIPCCFLNVDPKRIKKFSEAYRFSQLSTPKMLALNCKTRRNSSLLMPQTTMPYKQVFDRLKHLNKRLKFVVPDENGEEMAENIYEKFKIFYRTIKAFSKIPNYEFVFGKCVQLDLH